MNFSFLFDNGKGFDVRGLLAAIPVPLFLLLAFNFMVLGLVIIKVLTPYVPMWLSFFFIGSVGILPFFYAGYNAAKTYRLGIVSAISVALICFLIAFVINYYVGYYLFTNNVSGLGEVSSEPYPPSNMPGNEGLLPQILHYKTNTLLGKSILLFKFVGGIVISIVVGFTGWFISRYSVIEFFSLKGVKL